MDTRVTVLLRSDIFAFVQPLIAEQDKLPIERVVWDDEGLLLRILNRRLLRNAPNHMNESEYMATVVPSRSRRSWAYRLHYANYTTTPARRYFLAESSNKSRN